MGKKAFEGVKVGYARVSSYGQALGVQLNKLEKAGCSKIFKEKKSGRSIQKRQQLEACLDYLREGDVLYICKLDRLARNVRDLKNIAGRLEEEGVGLHVLDQKIDTTTPTGRLMFNMLGVIAEFENDLRRERQLEGIERAKARGVKFGAKKKLTEDEIFQLQICIKEGKKSMSQIAQEFGISRASLYRYKETVT